MYDDSGPAHRFLFWTSKQQPKDAVFTAGTRTAPALKDGKARLIVEATSNDLRGLTATDGRDINVVTQPPALSVDAAQHYINQGGAELVTFSVSGYSTASGVRAGGRSGPPTTRSSVALRR